MPNSTMPSGQQIRDLYAKGEKERGKRLLLDFIADAVRQKRFRDAENLRELLIELDPMALSDIVKTADFIEAQKSAAINKEHLAVWAKLAEVLDSGEFATLYHSLEQMHVTNGQLLVEQGSPQSALFFINSGKVELFFREKGQEIKIKNVGPGEIMGAGTFFEVGVWTLSARSLGADVAVLKLETLQQWQENYPGLESTLNDFCLRFALPAGSFTMTGRNRRVFERTDITGRVAVALLDKDGRETGVGAKGELLDISAGGVSFFLRISQKKNARLLFRRMVSLSMPSVSNKILGVVGSIRAVRSQPVAGNEYSVHVKFAETLDREELRSIVNAGRERE